MDFRSDSPWEKPEDIINPLKEKIKSRFSKGSRFPFVLGIIFMLLIITWPHRTVIWPLYTIQTNEVGVVLRFGKLVRTTDPGLHFKLPLGIERVIPVKVEYNYQEEFGFRTKAPGVRTVYSQKSYDEESLMLTGDLNVMNIEWIIQFKVKDPFNVLFKVRNVNKTLRDISESVMRKAVGDYTFNEVLAKRLEISAKVQGDMQKVLDSYDAGVNIVTVKLQDVNPPQAVKPAFNEVNQAKQEKKKMKNEADEVYYRIIPQAKGEALKMVKEAEGYATAKVNRAEGDAKRFLLLREAYARAKEVTQRRLYLENMRDILKGAGKKYIIDPDQKGIIPLLRLENEQ
ncbi:MAG: FtsH protease activity modulator HflK [Candidatus Omnitrophota bacterium]|nr:MAG: FtsH protease activity modulator HflK [Candidatus Omnitrophota bacterium]